MRIYIFNITYFIKVKLITKQDITFIQKHRKTLWVYNICSIRKNYIDYLFFKNNIIILINICCPHP